jgi:hypothetical protein
MSNMAKDHLAGCSSRKTTCWGIEGSRHEVSATRVKAPAKLTERHIHDQLVGHQLLWALAQPCRGDSLRQGNRHARVAALNHLALQAFEWVADTDSG